MDRPEVMIEKFLPIEAIGAECMRERGASSALPPLYFLHVWWARRPLTVCRAALLASVLPADTDPKWFLETLGIFGDPVASRKRIAEASKRNETLGAAAYGYRRAFTHQPDGKKLGELGRHCAPLWGENRLSVLDCFAGGGSIPFEALRCGFETYASELNPVASIILKATLDYPFRFGETLAEDVERWGRAWWSRVRDDLKPYFPDGEKDVVSGYIWARTVRCPECSLVIPLSPNWWVDKTTTPPTAARMIVPAKPAEDISFSIESVKRGAGWGNLRCDR